MRGPYLSTFESPYKRTLAGDSHLEMFRTFALTFKQQGQEQRQFIYNALKELYRVTGGNVGEDVREYVRGLGNESRAALDLFERYEGRERQTAQAQEQAAQAAEAYAAAMEATEAEAARKRAGEAAGYSAAQAAETRAAQVVTINDTPATYSEEIEVIEIQRPEDIEQAAEEAEQAAAVVVEEYQRGNATEEQAAQAIQVAAEVRAESDKNALLSKVVPLTVAAVLFIFLMKRK